MKNVGVECDDDDDNDNDNDNDAPNLHTGVWEEHAWVPPE